MTRQVFVYQFVTVITCLLLDVYISVILFVLLV